VELTHRLVQNIRRRCLRDKIPAGLTLREHVLREIYQELVRLLGDKPVSLAGRKKIMLVGLFGSGKTTTAAKLARHLQRQGLKTALICCDYHRPAAPEQLCQLGQQIHIPVYIDESGDPYKAAQAGLKKFSKFDSVIIDTAGRNALDRQLARELKRLSQLIGPDEVLLTIPADIGKVCGPQSAEFDKLVGITGVVVTKADGTARAGGALAATAATGAKVKFIGTGEKMGDLEVYNPERFVSRLLGLGDLATLLEKAKQVEMGKEVAEKIVEARFTLQDFYEQIRAMQQMGPLTQLVTMIPGLGAQLPKETVEQQERKMRHWQHIIDSMTPEERLNPTIIDASRIARIARGCGRPDSEVRELLRQYNQMRKVLRKLGGMAGLKRGQLKKLAQQFGFKF
jgi:signal recognition particle subunit SRP54